MKETVLNLLSDTALSVFALAEKASMDVGELQTLLNGLCSEGKVAVTKKGKYALPETLGLVPARASALRNGTPIACPMDGSPSMKIRALGRLRCLPDDTLLIRPVGDECELVCISGRGKTELPAFIRVRYFRTETRNPRKSRGETAAPILRQIITATACDRRITCRIDVSTFDLPVENDTIALLAIDRYPEGDEPMQAHVIRVLGEKNDMLTRLKVIAEDHGFPSEFPDAVRSQFSSLPDSLSEADRAGREDLRNKTVFTIDGPHSKDYDDAVSLERTAGGDFLLGVHIADVSHYVQPGSAVDREALERGTSLYLPGYTVPMLPEILSNDLCSLLPDEDRLTLSLFMTIHAGKIIDHRLIPAVIRSSARLTYDEVNRFFDGESTAVPESVRTALNGMLCLSHQLRSRRMNAGCLELDIPEAEFTLDELNIPTEICIAERGESERMIEDFMLAANETVALLARTTDLPLIYRIHEDPDSDRLRDLLTELSNLGIRTRFSIHPQPGELQALLDQTRDHPASDTIRRMLLRSLQKAQYSDQPVGHYALAMRDYCHFTSPIRRYPDLVVHRMLKMLICGTDSSSEASRMPVLSRQSTLREQESTYAERDSEALMKARFMQDRIGWRYDGIVSGVTSWGLYVTLPNTVEGLVPVSTMDDYYEFDRERRQLVGSGSRTVFRMGDSVRIKVESVDIDRAEIDFTLVPPRRCSDSAE